jgi:hypothetical protein
MKYLSLQLACLILFVVSGKALAQNYYTQGREILMSGITYVCQDDGGSILLYRKSTAYHFKQQTRLDGTPIVVGGAKKINSTPDDFKNTCNIITSCFTSEERKMVKGYFLVIGVYIDPNTGKVLDVDFYFGVSTGYAHVPPEKYHQIAEKIIKNVQYEVTSEGKKYNFIVSGIPVKIFTDGFAYKPFDTTLPPPRLIVTPTVPIPKK